MAVPEQNSQLPNVYNIPPEYIFVDCFARHLIQKYAADLSLLGDVTILTTTRRASRALQHAFLRETNGQPLLLPRMRPLGDVDEDELALEGGLSEDQQGALDLPPAIDQLRRQLLLSQLIIKKDPENQDMAKAASLALELAKLLDQTQTEGLELQDLKTLVPDEYAAHWQVTLEFLKIISDVWPALLDAEGAIDPAKRRDLLLRFQIEEWEQFPPSGPVYAVGSTGSIPATAALLTLVAKLPQGAVILPGLDQHLDEDTWQVVSEEPSHPQYGLARLLGKMGIDRAQVKTLSDENCRSAPEERFRFLSHAMRPASTTEYWQRLAIPDLNKIGSVQMVECSGAQAEAQVIALLMRNTLNSPQKTAALVTPDRDLSRRVSAELKRWDIDVDDSAGASLDQSPPGVFLRLTAEMMADRFDPLAVLAVLKHPYATMGYPKGRLRNLVREFEIKLLRGPKPAEGLAGLAELVRFKAEKDKLSEDLQNWFEAFCAVVSEFADLALQKEVPFEVYLKAHVSVTEALATPEGAEQSDLWRGHFGESAAGFVSELMRASDVAGFVDGAIWPELLDSLMVGRMVRSPYGQHPRLQIWGPIEARLQRADLMILGGLNKGVWPPEQAGDPWMSRPMRSDFKLPLPEKKIGLSAHDFQQAFCAKEVVITRAEKMDGAPTVPSRWILRLQTLLKKNQQSLVNESSQQWLHWQGLLDKPQKYSAITAPRPTPPLSARPRRLSVTKIEKWIRDPYSIFADAILKLKPLDDIGEAPGGAERGTFIHEALERFVKLYPDQLPDDAETVLLSIGEEVFADILSYPAVWAFWWPRFERMARWFVAFEHERRTTFKPALLEIKGELAIRAPYGSFVLSGTADRLDKSPLNEISIIDYKTGSIPSDKQVVSGISPQLALEANMAIQGAFGELAGLSVVELLYIRLSGGDPAGEARAASTKLSVEELMENAFSGLQRLIAQFDQEATPYLARPRPEFLDPYNDYEHLARVKEWSSGGSDDG